MGNPRHPPAGLSRMQVEFGQSIRTPFSFSTGRFQCRTEAYPDKMAGSIADRGARTGRERLAVYNEQYWYRLLTVLQQDFPLLAESMGLWNFNQVATAFLDRHPSRSPYLQDLSIGFPEFLAASPNHDIPRLLQIARLEMALLRAFHAPSLPPLNPSGLTSPQVELLPQTALDFQPWFSLVEEDWNLVECRAVWVDKQKEAPLFLERKTWWAVYRNGLEVEWQELDRLQFQLLTRLRARQTLETACEEMAGCLDPSDGEYLSTRMSAWFAAWTRLKWFAQPSFEGLVERNAEMV